MWIRTLEIVSAVRGIWYNSFIYISNDIIIQHDITINAINNASPDPWNVKCLVFLSSACMLSK